MDSRNDPMGSGDGDMDWNDPMFASTFNDAMQSDSPFGNSAFDSFTNMNDYSDSPGMLQMRTPSKSGLDRATAPGAQQQPQPHGMNMVSSVDTSSQDSSSDTSSRRKRKTASESPVSEADRNGVVKKEDSIMENDGPKMQIFGSNGMGNNMADNNMFGFGNPSGNSSPINPNTFDTALSLDNSVQQIVMPNVTHQYNLESPVSTASGQPPRRPNNGWQAQTINPATFTLGGGSRDQSPAMVNAMFNNSPNAIFSTPSSDSNETFNPNQTYNMGQNPAWTTDFNNQYTSPSQLHFTPSPVVNGSTPSAHSRASGGSARGRSRLHIAPISAKSRVETQINVQMTLERPPPYTEFLHLPLHTIAKSKLLAKEDVDKTKALELHTMLVCTSAMRVPEMREKALRNAGLQSNNEIQRRAEQHKDSGEEDRNDLKNIPEDDKPSNGGEVRICNNCIQRERKRAGRKKLKKEEEQQHWERYETERVVVFNSNEYLAFKAPESNQHAPRESGYPGDDYMAPDGSMQVTAAMRIACYCRHQSEKEGFQVIFTMKDQEGNVVAQEVSDSILITDDHKTHPPSFSTQMPEQMMFGAPVYAAHAAHGLPTSYSMVDMSQHVQPGFASSRSTGNLQGLATGGQYPHSHGPQMPYPGYNSQATSTTMTPTSLSRPGSPTNAGNVGPNKKRKSSSFHRKVPSGLTMTPRVDTNHGQMQNMSGTMSQVTSPFSPTSAGFNPQGVDSYISIPTNPNPHGPAQFISSGPPTPSESAPFGFNQTPQSARGQSEYYQSLPSSRVGSRAPSPVAGSRANLAAYTRQQMAPSQPPPRQQMYAAQQQPPAPPPQQQQQPQQQPQAMPGSSGGDMDHMAHLPVIHKISPTEGPITGGTEVSMYGRNFSPNIDIWFGDQRATAITCYGDQAMHCVSPPGRPGAVHVMIVPAGSVPQYPHQQQNRTVFIYKNPNNNNERMMEMALRFISQQTTGNANNWQSLAQQNATQFMSQNVNRAGLGGGYEGGNMLSTGSALLEDMVLRIFEVSDMHSQQPDFDMASNKGETLLTLAASAGLHRTVAALVARGASPDVRDGSGYTPLMHAALQGHTKIFQLLVVKGADPAIRSLSGSTVLDVAHRDMRDGFKQILLSTPRVRSTWPTLRSQPSMVSHASSTSWDISSASFYESEIEGTSQHNPSAPPSRRPSAHLILLAGAKASSAQEHLALQGTSATVAMQAWRDALATQIQQFQSQVHAHMPHFQLPPLANLPGYEDSSFARRLSSLMPSRMGSPQPSSEAPPAYNDLYPAKIASPEDLKAGARDAVIDTLADQKCAALFDQDTPSMADTEDSNVSSELASKGPVASGVPSWVYLAIAVFVAPALLQALFTAQDSRRIRTIGAPLPPGPLDCVY